MPEPLSTLLRKHALDMLYYWTHPSNIPTILELGLISYNLVHELQLHHESIAKADVQLRRNRQVPISGRSIHDYVPLYFVRRTPMLWDIKNHPHVCVRLSLRVADKPGTLFTDGNAASGATNFFHSPRDVDQIPWEVLHRKRWTGSQIQDGRRRRCAELLVPYRIEPEYILDVICHPLTDIEFPLGYRHLRENKPSFLDP